MLYLDSVQCHIFLTHYLGGWVTGGTWKIFIKWASKRRIEAVHKQTPQFLGETACLLFSICGFGEIVLLSIRITIPVGLFDPSFNAIVWRSIQVFLTSYSLSLLDFRLKLGTLILMVMFKVLSTLLHNDIPVLGADDVSGNSWQFVNKSDGSKVNKQQGKDSLFWAILNLDHCSISLVLYSVCVEFFPPFTYESYFLLCNCWRDSPLSLLKCSTDLVLIVKRNLTPISEEVGLLISLFTL